MADWLGIYISVVLLRICVEIYSYVCRILNSVEG